MDYEINLEALEQKNNDLQTLIDEVTNLQRSFNNNYINTLSGSAIGSVVTKINNDVQRLTTAYNNVEQWLNSYCQDLESLENNLANFDVVNITPPTEFKGAFSNLFSKPTIPTLKTGGNKLALYNSSIKTQTQTKITSIFNNIPDNLSNNKVPYLTQNDPQWSSIKFGDGNIGSSGCSITSIAMVLSYLKNENITPADVRQSIIDNTGNYKTFHTPGVGANWNIFSNVGNYYNVKCDELSTDSVITALKNGNPIIMSAKPGDFTNHGHFIVLTGITPNGKITVNDPNGSHKKYSYKEWDLNTLVNQSKGFWEYSI